MGKPIRRFSQGSPILSSYIHGLVSKDVKYKDDTPCNMPYLETMPEYSFVFPIDALNAIEEDPFVVDKRMKTSLEELKVINWCPGIKRLIPLSISNDGNSLCHAASVALWGIHDRSLELRHLVGIAMKSAQKEEFKQRWIRDAEKTLAGKLQDQEWKIALETEWEAQINISNEVSRSARMTIPLYASLEECHIYVLANVLRRPIIVLADRPITGTKVEDNTRLGGFSSIYLPLIWSSTECNKTPILLGYSENYFTPLVIFGSSKISDPSPEVIPLCRENNSTIEIRYIMEDESTYQEQLLKDYLTVVEIEATKSGKFTYVISAATLILRPLEETKNMLLEFLASRNKKTSEEQVDLAKEKAEPIPPIKLAQRRASLFRCGNKSCSLFITNDSTFPYCTECDQRNTRQPKVECKFGGQASIMPPVGLEVECSTVSCPYFATVNSFPYCQRCHLRCTSKQQRQQEQAITAGTMTPLREVSLEEKWLKLAMGIIDEEVVSGLSSQCTNVEELVNCIQTFPEQDEYMFANEHRMGPLEENEEIAIGGVTSTRSLSQDETRQRRSSVTGGRSNPLRRLSIEEENVARSGDEWQRRVSWVNEPCQKSGCPYFASLRTFPYCNQCAFEMQNTGILPPRRKISGTARILSTVTQNN